MTLILKKSKLLDCLASGILPASHVQPWESLFHLTPQILKRTQKKGRELKELLRRLFCRRNGPQVAFGAQARQQPGLGRGRGQPRQRRGQSGLRGGTRSQGRGTRGHPVGARQVGRAPQAVPIQRQLSLQYHVDDEDNRILNLSDDPPLNMVTVAEQVPESTLNPQDSLQDEVE